MIKFDLEQVGKSYAHIPGGPELLAFFGEVPSFHDAEIVGLELNRRTTSYLRIHGWVVDRSNPKQWIAVKNAVVTFALEGISDLELDGFSHQNVIGSLMITKAIIDLERKPYISQIEAQKQDFEIALEPCFGMDGRIRCKSISIQFEPGIPSDSRRDQKDS